MGGASAAGAATARAGGSSAGAPGDGMATTVVARVIEGAGAAPPHAASEESTAMAEPVWRARRGRTRPGYLIPSRMRITIGSGEPLHAASLRFRDGYQHFLAQIDSIQP